MEGRRKERKEEAKGGTLAERVLIITFPTSSIDLLLSTGKTAC